MAKKILCVIVITLALVCVLASCGHEHEWSEWQTTKEATCTTDGLKERVCECGEKDTQTISMLEHSYGEWQTIQPNCLIEGKRARFCERCGYESSYIISAKTSHYFPWDGWIVTKAATCTEEGEEECKCYYCDEKETETIPANHKYSNGICTLCNRGLINIILPDTPITVYDYNYNGSVDETCKITSLTIKKIEKRTYDGTYNITLCWAGEKTYDDDGNNYSSSVGFIYKLYDSEGYAVKSDSAFSVSVCVGEKFRDQEETLYDINLDPNETYTLEILHLD